MQWCEAKFENLLIEIISRPISEVINAIQTEAVWYCPYCLDPNVVDVFFGWHLSEYEG